MRVPPGVPSAMNGLPSCNTTVGDMLRSMRLPGAIALAVPGTVTLEPNSSLMVCVLPHTHRSRAGVACPT